MVGWEHCGAGSAGESWGLWWCWEGGDGCCEEQDEEGGEMHFGESPLVDLLNLS